MKEFVISTDSTASLPESFLKENNVAIHPLHYIIDGEEFGMDLGHELSTEDFYQCIKDGKMPTTSATNPAYIEKVMREQLAQGYDILHIGFSSGISCSYNNAHLVGEQLMEEFPDSKIIVIDSLSAECGQGLLVYKAVQMKKEGKTIDEIASWIEEYKHNMVHHFTLEDLFHLVRGGRLSKSSAVLGTALNIQPILHVDDNGKLANIAKARGRKKAIKTLVDTIANNTEGFDRKEIFLSHSDCEDDVKYLESLVREAYPEATIMILPISPTVGSHTGVGTLVVSYFGNKR